MAYAKEEKCNKKQQLENTQKGINIITIKNTYIDLEVKEQPLIHEELVRHTA